MENENKEKLAIMKSKITEQKHAENQRCSNCC